MAVAPPLFLTVPPDRARRVLAATLSEQGFTVRERAGLLEVERDVHPTDANGVARRVTFLVRIAAGPGGGSSAHFGESGGSIVVTAAARVAHARLAERGIVVGAAPASLHDRPDGSGTGPDAAPASRSGGTDGAGGPADRLSGPTVDEAMPESGTPTETEGERTGGPVASAAGVEDHSVMGVAGPPDDPVAPGAGAEDHSVVGVAGPPDDPVAPGAGPDDDAGVAAAPVAPGAGPDDDAGVSAAPAQTAAAPAAAPEAAPLHPVAMLAFVLAFVAPLGGVVAGAFALGILRRSRERGRGLAIAGVVLGSILTVVMGAAVVAGTWWLTAVATTPDTPAPTPSAISAPGDGATPTAFEPEVGQCFAQRGRGEIGDANLVACSVPHSYELFAQFAAADDADPYPGDEGVARDAEAGCREAFDGFVGLAYDRSALDYVYLSPTGKTWAAGDRRVSCFVIDPTGPTTGSLGGSAR